MSHVSQMNTMRPANEWEQMRLMLSTYDVEVDDHPTVLALELFDKALMLARIMCGEDV
jgi:hypothetical protein